MSQNQISRTSPKFERPRNSNVLHGALNIQSGDVLLLITEEWDQQTHQCFLRMIRSHWRGWGIVLFEDRGSPHKAEGSLQWPGSQVSRSVRS